MYNVGLNCNKFNVICNNYGTVDGNEKSYQNQIRFF